MTTKSTKSGKSGTTTMGTKFTKNPATTWRPPKASGIFLFLLCNLRGLCGSVAAGGCQRAGCLRPDPQELGGATELADAFGRCNEPAVQPADRDHSRQCEESRAQMD